MNNGERKKIALLLRSATVLRTAALLSLLVSVPLVSVAQSVPALRFFPDSIFVDPFAADVNSHDIGVENIIGTKNVKTTLGTSTVVANVLWQGTTLQASVGGSVRFELHPQGQAQIVSNEYAVDFVTIDIPFGSGSVIRFVSGHTSHHLSDNWYERLRLTSAVRYSRDYVRLIVVRREGVRLQWYFGADYAYILTIGTRRSTPWVFQAGGTYLFPEFWTDVAPYVSTDSKIRQESDFAATHAIQCGVRMKIRDDEHIRFAYQFTTGSDDRGQFFPAHRTLHTVGISFDR